MEISQYDQLIPDSPNIHEGRAIISGTWREENFFDPQNLNNKKVLNSLYGKEIFSVVDKLSTFKDNSNTYLDHIKEELSTKYKTFNNEMLKYINITTNKIINAFQFTDLSNISESKSKLIHEFSAEKIYILKKIISLHKQIFEVIQQNFLILENFLHIFELMDKEQPIQDFFTKEFDNILKSWLFLKLDLEKFNFKNVINSSSLNQNYKDFILKECQGKNSVMNIVLPEQDEDCTKHINREKYKKEIKTLSENMSHLIKLNMVNVPNVEEYLGKSKYDKLEKLKFINVQIVNNNIFNQFPSLEKLKIKYCPLLDMSIFNSINQINLKKLILNKNGFVNQDFDNLISNYLIKAPKLLNSLELLSLSSNNISKIDFSHHLVSRKHAFHSLKSLILNKNDLYKIIINLEYFPELKLIDCCHNNLAINYFKEFDKNNNIIILQSGNFFLTDEELGMEYYTNLKNKLINMNNYSFTSLNISYLTSKCSQTFFKELNINYSLLIKLKKLILSYNSLSCNSFFNFIGTNKECLNLETLNLIGNNLDDTFFEKYLNLGLNKIFSNLQNLYLNDNKIGGETKINYEDNDPVSNMEKKKDIFKLRLMYKFIAENKNLKKLTITKNPIKEKFVIKYEPSQNAETKDEYIVKDNDGNIIINCFYSFLVKIKNELLDRDDYKKDRKGFNIGFDCAYDVNLNSENYPYSSQPIVFK